MTRHEENSGISTHGGTTNFHGPVAVGAGATVNVSGPQQPGRDRRSAALGVVTVIAEEAAAVRSSLALEPVRIGSLGFDVGSLPVHGKPVTVAATRALNQGEESAMAAYGHLCEHFAPAVVALTGIAGGIHPEVRCGDVVVATRVVCYDLRKETPAGTDHRGQEQQAPAEIGHAVNGFFTARGEPAEIRVAATGGTEDTIRVLHGPIGSGNAVIADHDSEILRYLAGFNNKVLAVDMEAAGFSQAYHEGLAPSGQPPLGWLVIRGISDDAGPGKNDDYHELAARNAALTLRELLPYLPLAGALPLAGT